MNGFYYKPPFHVAAELEDRFVDAMVAIRTGDDHYPGDIKTSPNWPGIAPGARGMNNALSPAYVNLAAFANVSPQPKVLWIRGNGERQPFEVTLGEATPIADGSITLESVRPDKMTNVELKPADYRFSFRFAGGL